MCVCVCVCVCVYRVFGSSAENVIELADLDKWKNVYIASLS